MGANSDDPLVHLGQDQLRVPVQLSSVVGVRGTAVGTAAVAVLLLLLLLQLLLPLLLLLLLALSRQRSFWYMCM